MVGKIQKLKNKDKYITLKEAGEISGYSSDYVGQLIRQGKISGKQFYCNVAWVTTKQEIDKYLDNKSKPVKRFNFRVLYLKFKNNLSNFLFAWHPIVIFKSFVYSILILIIGFSVLFLFVNLNEDNQKVLENNIQITKTIEFVEETNQIIRTSMHNLP